MAKTNNEDPRDLIVSNLFITVMWACVLGLGATISTAHTAGQEQVYATAERDWNSAMARVEAANDQNSMMWEDILHPVEGRADRFDRSRDVRLVFFSDEPMTVKDWNACGSCQHGFSESLLNEIEMVRSGADPKTFAQTMTTPPPNKADYVTDWFSVLFGGVRLAYWWFGLSLLTAIFSNFPLTRMLALKGSPIGKTFRVLMLAPLYLPLLVLIGAWRAGRNLLPVLSDMANPYRGEIRQAKRCLKVLRQDGVEPDAIAAAEELLEYLRNRSAIERREKEDETARRQRSVRLTNTRDVLLTLLTEAELDGDQDAEKKAKRIAQATHGS